MCSPRQASSRSHWPSLPSWSVLSTHTISSIARLYLLFLIPFFQDSILQDILHDCLKLMLKQYNSNLQNAMLRPDDIQEIKTRVVEKKVCGCRLLLLIGRAVVPSYLSP